jgi:hypothetical protein
VDEFEASSVAMKPKKMAHCIDRRKAVIMPELKIPEEHRNTLVRMASLTDEQTDKLISLLGSVQAAQLTQIIADLTNRSVEMIDVDLKQIVETLISIHTVRAYLDVPAAEFIEQVIASLGKQGHLLNRDSRERLVNTLATVLEMKPYPNGLNQEAGRLPEVWSSGATSRSLEREWLRQHQAEYAGSWVALEGRRLVACDLPPDKSSKPRKLGVASNHWRCMYRANRNCRSVAGNSCPTT